MVVLSTLDSVLGAQPSFTIDFLLPACTLQGIIYPLTPMSYAGALALGSSCIVIGVPRVARWKGAL